MTPATRRRRQPPELPTDYVVAIRRWDWSYIFGLNAASRESDPYMDFRHLNVHGVLTHPRRLENEEIEITIIPDHDLGVTVRGQQTQRPLAVGSIGRNRKLRRLQGYLSMPEDALHTVLLMLGLERLKFIVLHGTRLGRGGAKISSYRLTEAVTEDDLYEA